MHRALESALITTVIPTYRRPRLLRRAIRSVLAQTYPHLQICVYDDASGDETASLVAELARTDSRIKYHCHTKRLGLIENFAYGMEHVATPFFSILPDDDILLPKFYETALEGFEQFPSALLSALATIRIDERGRVTDVPILDWKPGFYPPPDGLVAILEHPLPDVPGILLRREVMEKVGPLDQEVGMSFDLDLWLRIAARFPIVVSRTPGAFLVRHRGTVSLSGGLSVVWPGGLKMIHNLAENESIPGPIRQRAEQDVREYVARSIFTVGVRSLVWRNWQEADQAAAVLGNQLRRRLQASLIRTSIKACRRLPGAHSLLLGLYALRTRLARLKYREVQSQYGPRARELGIGSEE